jgi:hypothetical protein
MERGSMTIQQRIDRIAQQAVSTNTPPASTLAWQTDVDFGRAHSMLIWDAVSALRSGKQAPPPVPRNSPHPTPLPRREPDRDLSEDTEDADEVCPNCDGTGRAEDGDMCDRCHGTGRVLQDDDDQDQDDDRDDDQHADDSDDSDFD